MITVILWKWSESGVKRAYTGAHVDAAVRMIKRNYNGPLRFVCITDDPFDVQECTTYPLWEDARHYKQPRGKTFPACYHRLKIFDHATARNIASHCFHDSTLGRCVSVDLDAVVVRSLNPLWDRPEPFVGWRVTNGLKPRVYNGSMFIWSSAADLLGAADPQETIWSRFIADPPSHIAAVTKAGFKYGSDQSVMAYELGQNRPHWTAADGVLSFRLDKLNQGKALPADARVVFFHGGAKPWQPEIAAAHKWVRDNWG